MTISRDPTIRVGDLVVVVKAADCCHGASESLGRVFTVQGVVLTASRCKRCRCVVPEQWQAEDSERNAGGLSYVYQLHRLQKINPPATGTEAQTSRERHDKRKHPRWETA